MALIAGYPTEKLLVAIDHPHGLMLIDLSDWIRLGPGDRPLIRPLYLQVKDTGQRISIRRLPWRLRNTFIFRVAVKLRIAKTPWRLV